MKMKKERKRSPVVLRLTITLMAESLHNHLCFQGWNWYWKPTSGGILYYKTQENIPSSSSSIKCRNQLQNS